MLSSVEAIRGKGGKPLKNQNYLKEVLGNTIVGAGPCACPEQGRPQGAAPTSKAGQAIAALQEWAGTDWLRLGIAAGLAAAVAQNLTKTPAAEMITLNADVWHLALKKQLTIEEVDAPRLHQAFELLLPKLTEWPQPKQLVEQLPKRPARTAIRHEPTAEEFARTAATARRLREETGI